MMKKNFCRILLLLTLLLLLLCTTACGICFHKRTETVIPPTCTEEGKTVRECVKCGKVDEVDIVAPLGHNYTKTTYSVTCDSEGYTEYVCHCGFSYKVDIITPTGHVFTDTVTNPTCETLGHTLHVCQLCDYEFVDSYLKPLGHTPDKTVTEPTCTEPGFTTYVCECGYTYVTDHIEPLGHALKKTVTSPTCTDGGSTLYSCDCGYEYTADLTKPLGHTLTNKTTPPTCTDEGYTTYSCDCGYAYVSDVVSPNGHKFTETITRPTVSDMGFSEYKCDCGFSYVGKYRFYSEILDNAYADNSVVLAEGIDISKHNHEYDSATGIYLPLDFEAIKAAGFDYVILKAGSTIRNNGASGGIEPTFYDDYEAAKAAGLDVGVYFFTYSTTVEGIVKDAEDLAAWLDGMTFEYPIYLDLEDVPNENYYASNIASPILTEMCLSFFSSLQSKGYYTGLYVNNTFLNSILQTENMIELFEIWYARYPLTEGAEWNTSIYGEHLGMWQYTMTGSLPTVSDKDLDFNYCYKDYPSIMKKYGFNGY